uniref:CocE/NonD family hydrolase n=1 Tax=Paenarthrobacter nicotinovorans TaxID=29320 RepID=UPI003F4914F8
MSPSIGHHEVQTLTDDGVRLAADYYRTSDRAARGTILIRTPYGKTHYTDQAWAWVRAGYDVVAQDVRGRYGSSGDWQPYTHEGQDGAATTEQLLSLGRFRRPLILAGASYDAHCALEAARVLEAKRNLQSTARPADASAPVAVVAMVPAMGLYETARQPDGTPRLRDRIGWWHRHGFGRTSKEPLHAAELQLRTRQAEERGMGWVLESLIRDAEYGPGSNDKWRQLWDAPPLDLHSLYSRLSTPLLIISGREDFFVDEALALARVWGSEAPGTLVGTLWGPWGHGLTMDLDTETTAALRGQGGLMARIKNFLALAGGLNQSTAADGLRPQVLQWQHDDLTGSWSWTPTTIDSLQYP